MTVKTVTRKHACAICGKQGRAANMTYSRHTGNHFCLDTRACERRAKKAQR
jgi:hypothetical protein